MLTTVVLRRAVAGSRAAVAGALPAGGSPVRQIAPAVCQFVVQPRWFAAPATPAAAAGAPAGTGAAAAAATKTKKKKVKHLVIKKRSGPTYPIDQSLKLLKSFATTTTFDEAVEVVVQLGVDPRKPNQNVRGVVQLPFGTGSNVVVAVFARGDAANKATAAGAQIVGAEDLVEMVQAGNIKFSKCIATPDMMPLVGKVARILGPRGLMPNPKLGTVTTDVASAVKNAKAGQAEFRTEKMGIVHGTIGRTSFPLPNLKENLRAFMVALGNAKPDSQRGAYFRHAVLKSSHGPAVTVEMQLLDPTHARFMSPDPVSASAAAAAAAAPAK